MPSVGLLFPVGLFGLALASASANVPVPTVQIASGVEMPLLGFGTGTFDKPMNFTFEAVKDALRVGYRMIDTAHNYGNQVVIGQVRSVFCILFYFWSLCQCRRPC